MFPTWKIDVIFFQVLYVGVAEVGCMLAQNNWFT